MNNHTSPSWQLIPIMSVHYPIRTQQVTCVLYHVIERRVIGQRKRRFHPDASSVAYAIGMESGEERDLCVIGTDPERAKQLYGQVVRMTVTPCTLRDVVEDYRSEQQL